MTKLPKTFQGAAVVRGLGMKGAQLESLLERKALDQFDATADMWLVVEDRALADRSVEVKGFKSQADAVRYARACANGNVDHRVLRVTQQTFVVSTDGSTDIDL